MRLASDSTVDSEGGYDGIQHRLRTDIICRQSMSRIKAAS